MDVQDRLQRTDVRAAALSPGIAAAFPPLPAYALYEVTITRADLIRAVRVRAMTAEEAGVLVLEHRPEWTLLTIRRWAEEGWVTA